MCVFRCCSRRSCTTSKALFQGFKVFFELFAPLFHSFLAHCEVFKRCVRSAMWVSNQSNSHQEFIYAASAFCYFAKRSGS